MSRHLCQLFRSWIACPILGIIGYWIVIYGSMVTSHWANPEIRFLGLELIGVPVFGIVGGLVVALGFNLARPELYAHDDKLSQRIAPVFAGIGFALNGLVCGWLLMLPILAIWNSYDGTVPLFLEEEDRQRWNQWCNTGACAFAAIAFASGFMIQALDRNFQSKERQTHA